MKKFLKNNLSFIITVCIFILALLLRTYGINWDQGNHLHPDERFLTMVANDIKLPESIGQYFNNQQSPLNPYNYKQFQFFVYGTFPVFLTKTVAVILKLDNYDSIHLVGRFLSAIADSFVVILLYFVTKKILSSNQKIIYLPSFLYATSVLPIQLSHYYAVDTFLSVFLLATFTLLLYDKFMFAAITFGLALACKISASFFIPVIAIFLISYYIRHKNIFQTIWVSIYSALTAFVVFRTFQPYIFDGMFMPNQLFIENLKTLKSFSDPNGWFPPAVQWMSKVPLSFSLQNIILWGIGIPGSILFITAFFKRKKASQPFYYYLALFWILFLYFVQGSQFSHNMRYFLPIYPFIFLIIAIKLKDTQSLFVRTLIILHVVYGLSFLNIYSHPHSRYQASTWIYQNIPNESRLTYEEWDDPLPLSIADKPIRLYKTSSLSMFDPDQPKKWAKLSPLIDNADFVMLSSNRLWGSIPLLPSRYPETARFYQDLFNEKLNFQKVHSSKSYPGFSLPFVSKCYYFGPSNYPGTPTTWLDSEACRYPGIYLRDNIAEESFTVYDHPEVFIFAKKSATN